MVTRSVQMVRHELNNATRFLKELDDALQVLENLGYGQSSDSNERKQYRELNDKVQGQKAIVAELEAELNVTWRN